MGRVYLWGVPNSQQLPPPSCLTLSAEGTPAIENKWFSTFHPHSRNYDTRQNVSCYGAFPIPDLISISSKISFSESLLYPWH